MARGLYVVDQLPPIDVATRAAFTTFTTFADVYGAPQKILPKSRMDVGVSLDLEAWGEFSTTGTPTLSIGFWFNGGASTAPTTLVAPTTILAQCVATTTGSAAAAWPWHAHWMGVLQAVGAGATGGTWEGQGTVDLGTSLTAMTGMPMPTTQALRTVTCDVTADRKIGVGAAWGTSSASNSITVRKFYAKIMS
jgi:hypothetical protein